MTNEEITLYGKKCVSEGLAMSFFGNISFMTDRKISITKTGSMLDMITDNDIVEVDLTNKDIRDNIASSELIVHRMIYNSVNCSAILHTHSLYSILIAENQKDQISFNSGELLPFLSNVPICYGKSGSLELAESVSRGLKNNSVVIVKDHGVFACGNSLKNCYIYISSLEHYSKIEIYKKIMNK